MTWEIDGRQVLITGGNSGIGRATAEQLARRGARVTITSRDEAKGREAADDVRSATGAEVEVGHLDLCRLDSVRDFARDFLADHDRLDVLINNAGVMAGARRETPDGLEWTFAVNHLGPFLLTDLLTDLLVAGAPARIITVSSEVHRRAAEGLDFDDLQMTTGYSSSKAYAASKLANILFTVELDRRLGDSGVTARALHPGVVATSFGRGPDSPRSMGLLMSVLKPVLRKPARGARTPVFLATADDRALAAGLYWSDEQPKEPVAAAVDVEAATRLWSESERLVDGGA
jgi:NAD(P)-dependent dehydrogenase (short-subunit alcohol dehydrogenase family)